MTTSVFVTIWINAISPDMLAQHFLNEPLTFLRSNSHVVSVDFYTPASGDIPVMDDIPAPSLIVQIDFNSEQQAQALTESESFKKLFTDKDRTSVPADKINLEVLNTVHFDLPGHAEPPPRVAPLSFVVRYYGPVEDAADFVDFYMKNHPPILAKFPDIRNVLCYVPVDWRKRGKLADDRLIIGNEVVFDNVEALNNAIASDVIAESTADFERFQPFGYNSHHAMHREQVYSRQ